MRREPETRHERGRAAEEMAARFLELEGYVVLARNLRCAGVEVDLVARRGDLLVLAEVKLRRHGLVPAARALGMRQWLRQRRAAQSLLVRWPWAATVRLDLVGVDWSDGSLRIRHLRGVTPGSSQDT
jgi:putative endonuclease